MKTHFASVEKGNESNPHDEWSDALCGTYTERNVDDSWDCVNCKKCLKQKSRYEEEMKFAMEHSINDMAQFMKFIEDDNRNNKTN